MPTWYHGSVGVLDLDGNATPVVHEEARETTAAKTVTVGAEGHGTIVEH